MNAIIPASVESSSSGVYDDLLTVPSDFPRPSQMITPTKRRMTGTNKMPPTLQPSLPPLFERSGAAADVNGAEPGNDLGWHQPDERLKVGEAAQRTPQTNLLNDLILVSFSRFRWFV